MSSEIAIEPDANYRQRLTSVTTDTAEILAIAIMSARFLDAIGRMWALPRHSDPREKMMDRLGALRSMLEHWPDMSAETKAWMRDERDKLIDALDYTETSD